MDENFLISNIPLIFTQYRSKVLEESGNQWFHSDNNPHCLAVLPKTADSQELQATEAETLTVADTSEVAETQTAPIQAPSNFDPAYVHPDPWDSEPLDAIAVKPSENESLSPGLEIIEPKSIQTDSDGAYEEAFKDDNQDSEFVPSAQSASTVIKQTSVPDAENNQLHPSNKVNLFPFESSSNEDPGDAKYDLTEFDNGEIEVPPVAVRESQQAKFEKVNQTLKNATPFASEDEESSNAEDRPSKSNRNTRPKPASAEIAKYRLRNCI